VSSDEDSDGGFDLCEDGDGEQGNANQTLQQQAIGVMNRLQWLWYPNWQSSQAELPCIESVLDVMEEADVYEDLLDCCVEATENVNNLRSEIDRLFIEFEWADRLFEITRTCSDFWQRARGGRRRSA